MAHRYGLYFHACHKISSFEKKPANPGIPAIASVATSMVRNVTGIFPDKSPMFRMSCSPLMA